MDNNLKELLVYEYFGSIDLSVNNLPENMLRYQKNKLYLIEVQWDKSDQPFFKVDSFILGC